MGLFRGLNLLQSVEAQNTLGDALEAILVASPAREGEFGALLSTRHMARRMAGNPVTMEAINSSASAIKIVFERAAKYNSKPVEEVANNSIAMANTSRVLATLNTVADNDVSWKYYSASPYYVDNVVNTLATLIGQDSDNFTSLSELILVPSHMGDIAGNLRAMKALVASPAALSIAVSSTEAMGDIYANLDGMRIWAKSDKAMKTLSNSQVALNALTDNVRRLLAYDIPSAVRVMSSIYSTWNHVVTTSTILHLTAPYFLRAINELDEDIFPTTEEMFADTEISLAIANSRASVMVIIGEPGTLDVLINSSNLETILASPVAIKEMIASESTMSKLIADEIAFPILLTSKVAKEAIFSSPALIATMMAPGSSSLATLQKRAVTVNVPNDIKIGEYIPLGVRGNVFLMTGILNSIVATTIDNYFKGDTQAKSTFPLPGRHATTSPIEMHLPFTNLLWDINSAAATAAATITATYVDFN
jgi:hypothetical protein